MNIINGIYNFNIKQFSVLGLNTTIGMCTLSQFCSAPAQMLSSKLPNEILDLKNLLIYCQYQYIYIYIYIYIYNWHNYLLNRILIN